MGTIEICTKIGIVFDCCGIRNIRTVEIGSAPRYLWDTDTVK